MRVQMGTAFSRGLLIRLSLALCALLVALWLAGNLRSLDRSDEAAVAMGSAVAGGSKAKDIERADRLFVRARRFAPDAPSRVQEAGILLVAAPRRSAALLRRALLDEPDNLEAWLFSYVLAKGPRDPAGVRARRRALALDPEVGPLLDRVDAARR
ncbi:MAG: hypothetical protein ACR2HC_08670 [Thermoleophilaceae bacterium]